MLDRLIYKHGQIFWYKETLKYEVTEYLRSCGYTVGSRPVIIFRNIETNPCGVTIIPLTSSELIKNGVKLNIDNGCTSTALCTEIRNVPISSLTTYMGTISDEKMAEIDSVVAKYLGLEKVLPEDYSTYFSRTVNLHYSYDIHTTDSSSGEYSSEHTPQCNTPDDEPTTFESEAIEPPSTEEIESVEQTSETVNESKPKTPRAYCKRVKPESFSLIELAWLNIAKITDVQKLFGCSYQTAVRRRYYGKQAFVKPIRETLDLYEYFIGKSLTNLNKYEHDVFKNLDSETLSKVLRLRIDIIEAYQNGLEVI